MPADPDKLQIATAAPVFNVWHLRTFDALEIVMSEGYFDSVTDHGLRIHDRIAVVANDTSPDGAQYADLVVVADEARPNDGLHIQVRNLR